MQNPKDKTLLNLFWDRLFYLAKKKKKKAAQNA
jgi:hypothetical protein